MSNRRRHPKNRRPWKGGWQTYVEVNGHEFYQSWPANASTESMDGWVEQQRRDNRVVGPKRGSFAEDVAEFLSRIAAARTYRQLSAYLHRWLDALGRDRPRHGIKARDIDRVLQQWEQDGLGAASRQKHRMILMALWNRLDGKDAPNPVRGVPRPQVAKPEARGVPYPAIQRILAAMPTTTEKQQAAKRRVAVFAYTGIPPGTIARIVPDDLNLQAGTVRVSARRKGRGVEARTLPLAAAGRVALKAFDAANDYGPFRVDLLSRAFKRAARRAQLPAVRLYDLRHSFATALYRETKDLETVARFLQHSSTTLTQRYAKSATDDIDKLAAKALGRSLSQQPVPKGKRTIKVSKK